MSILFVYTLLKGVSYHDLSVLSMSVMSFQEFFWMECELYSSLFLIFGICLTLQSPFVELSCGLIPPHVIVCVLTSENNFQRLTYPDML